MSSKIKVDTIENVAGSGNVSLGSGHNLVVPGNITGQGTTTLTDDLTVDTNTLFVDASADKVGINNTTPGSYLSSDLVVGDTTGDNAITVVSGNANASGIFFQDTTGVSIVSGVRYQHDINKMGLWTNGSERLSIDADGHVLMPKQSAFLVTNSADQNNVTTLDTVVFDSEVFDQNGDFASNTFTAPVTGRYQMSYCLRIDNVESDAIYTRTRLVTSNRTIQPTIIDLRNLSGDPAYWHFQVSILTDMDANDTAYVEFNQSQGTTQADIKVTSFFSGYLAC